ncbi:hypothetical protein EDI_002590 [Entamoeba dispar SAW760]|uniref:Uncharacterized protein n=1 Tax=Entamoeba dispar (strain ATCC PRA-260 / SAW760) TaxID=370354 RepID=B0EJ87_ENTDS|nr:uncharacterized protein EDI_002590 [Entamoeba dispar SAW760]EDR25395.1 hypothetical protein EDI_002590 [Entamoeba dispar SAW760]|eukprot:EDR25395.1 hypothetical protein EDI_002590 [Entamoeba dispar SAW760]
MCVIKEYKNINIELKIHFNVESFYYSNSSWIYVRGVCSGFVIVRVNGLTFVEEVFVFIKGWVMHLTQKEKQLIGVFIRRQKQKSEKKTYYGEVIFASPKYSIFEEPYNYNEKSITELASETYNYPISIRLLKRISSTHYFNRNDRRLTYSFYNEV